MEFLDDIFSYGYLSNAVLACLLSGIACGLIGTYIVARRTVFLAGGITHASFGGIGVAVYAGVNPIMGAMVFAVLSSLGIEYVSSNTKIREDSAIGIIWGLGMAVGAFFLSLRPGYTSGDLSSFLFGSIVTVTSQDVVALAVLSAFLLLCAAIWFRKIMYVAFDRGFARSSGVNVSLVSYLMAVVTAVTLVLSIHIMGIVLLISLYTLPVVIVNMFTKSYSRLAVFSSIAASLASVLGIALSYYAEVPSGPSIIFVLSCAYALGKLSIFVKYRLKR